MATSTSTSDIIAVEVKSKSKSKIEWNVHHKKFASLTADEKEQLSKLFAAVFNSPIEDSIISDADDIFWIADGSDNSNSKMISMAVISPRYNVDQLKYDFFHNTGKVDIDSEADCKINTVHYLSSVGTLLEYRRQGCTSAILKFVLDESTKLIQSSNSIFLEVSERSPNAMRLYSNFGFNFPTCVVDKPDSKVADECKTIFEGEVFYLMSKSFLQFLKKVD